MLRWDTDDQGREFLDGFRFQVWEPTKGDRDTLLIAFDAGVKAIVHLIDSDATDELERELGDVSLSGLEATIPLFQLEVEYQDRDGVAMSRNDFIHKVRAYDDAMNDPALTNVRD